MTIKNDAGYGWNNKYLLSIMLIFTIFQAVDVYPSGAPNEACSLMDPSISSTHNGGRQLGKTPLKFTTNKEIVAGNDSVILTIKGNNKERLPAEFRGFMLQGRTQNSNEIFGRFVINDNDPDLKLIKCDDIEGSSITHQSSRKKSALNITWIAPVVYKKEAVQFYITLVTARKMFWVKQKAGKVVHIVPTNTYESKNSSVIEKNPDLKLIHKHQHVNDFEPKNCIDGSNSCFGFPNGCLNSKSCEMMTTYSYDATKQKLHITINQKGLKNDGYIAMAFSLDNKMGDDLVFSCSISRVDVVRVGWNIGQNGPYLQPQNINITDQAYMLRNNEYECSFNIDKKLTFIKPGSSEEITFDFDEKYFILLAHGANQADTNPGYHLGRASSDQTVNLKEKSKVTSSLSSSQSYVILHGGLMVICWIALAPTGMIIARYYKQTWKNIKPFKKDLWFRIHQTIMVLVIIMSIVSFSLMCYAKGFLPYSIEDIFQNPHPATGFSCIVCAVAQMIMAYFRPNPKASKRWIFAWLHWFTGNSAYLLGLSSLFLTANLPSSPIDRNIMEIALKVNVVLHIIMHLALTIQHHTNSFRNKTVNEYYPNEEFQEAPGSSFRKFTAFIYFTFVWFTTIYIITRIAQDKNQ